MGNGRHAPKACSTSKLVERITDYAVYVVDAQGCVMTWNAGAQRMKGYTAREAIGCHISQFYTEADRNRNEPDRALNTAQQEGRFATEGWQVRKNGSRFWADVSLYRIGENSDDVAGYAKVTRDITNHKRSRETLSDERFRLLVEGVTDYAIYMLDPLGNIATWNAGAERFKGYRAEEILGQHFSRFYTPEDLASGVPDHALRTAREVGHFEAEGWRLRKNGSRFWANVVIDPIRASDGELIGFTKITRDLTERRESQLELENAREALFQAQKMEAVGKLTGGVAHDFNNLLSAIRGSLELAQRRMQAGEDISLFLDNARQAVDRGAELTQRMLAFARKQELRIEEVDLAAAVSSMAELLGHTIGPTVEIYSQFPLSLPKARTDRTQFELALVNLIVNARDAMPQGGRITISARTGSPPARGAARDNARPTGDGADDPGYVCLSVSDQGTGMDADTLARAAEPFFTTKGIGEGTGLGLSMVQGMLEQCGGSLNLLSEPGAGTTAELWLPRSPARVPDPATPAPVGPDAAHEASRRLRILAVDDDPIVLMNTAMMLEDMGHRPFEATSASKALAILGVEQIDLLVTDYAMPGMTGAELIERARALQPGLRVILVSGYVELPDAVEIGIPRLAKPFTEAELASAVAATAAAE